MGIFRSSDEKNIDKLAEGVINAIQMYGESISQKPWHDLTPSFDAISTEFPYYLSFGIRHALLIESFRNVQAVLPINLADRYGKMAFKLGESSKVIGPSAAIDLINYTPTYEAMYGRTEAAARWIIEKVLQEPNNLKTKKINTLKPLLEVSHSYIRGAMEKNSPYSFPFIPE